MLAAAIVVGARLAIGHHQAEHACVGNVIVGTHIVGVDGRHAIKYANEFFHIGGVEQLGVALHVGCGRLGVGLGNGGLVEGLVVAHRIFEEQLVEGHHRVHLLAVGAVDNAATNVEGVVGLALVDGVHQVATLQVLVEGAREADALAVDADGRNVGFVG